MVPAAMLPSVCTVVNNYIYLKKFSNTLLLNNSLWSWIFFMYVNQIIYHNTLNTEASIRIQFSFVKVHTGLERWLSNWGSLQFPFFQRTPAPISGGSWPLVNPAPGDLTSSGFYSHLNIWYLLTQTYINKTNKINLQKDIY